MRRHYVRSSGLRSVGYDEKSSTLEIEFITGRVYRYFAVPKSLATALMAAASIGAYFNEHIRERFPTQAVS